MTKIIALALSIVAGAFVFALFGSLTLGAIPNFRNNGLAILTIAHWNFHHNIFGALSMIYGTIVVTLVAILIAVPIGLGSAIYVSEFLEGKVRALAKVSIELLSGVPSVIYGLLGVMFLREWVWEISSRMGGGEADTLLTAGILLSIMILPTMMTLSDDALRCIPRKFREAGWSLGLSRRQVVLTCVLPQALPGIFGAFLLSVGRAVGETIAVYLVIGRADQPVPNLFSLESLLKAGQTMTTKLGAPNPLLPMGIPDIGLQSWL